ncbi:MULTISPECIES: hypothetical protein [Pseudomonas syringae group]|uniref:hypothetical protein n=1 Tax=Pseudomonas syringae group TaxID=136849 RepID=UPI000EFF2C70|nr:MULTISPECIES: hypothetical protein [Pseudomonas syringae group]
MAKLFQRPSLVAAWLDAAQYLATLPSLEDQNLILEISDPLSMTVEAKAVLGQVDRALSQNVSGITISTVADTIFPLGVYLRHGRPAFYEKFTSLMVQGKAQGTWGTYALRMIRRTSGTGKKAIQLNPLEILVQKLVNAHTGRKLKAHYELGVVDVVEDVLPFHEVGIELPIYDPAKDARKPSGYPCLSHISFKLINQKIHLTAVYRSHYYGTRALGNLVGLTHLLWFVAKESNFGVGTLTCVSTHARLEPGSLASSVKETRVFVNSLKI